MAYDCPLDEEATHTVTDIDPCAGSRTEPLDPFIWFRQVERLRADLERADGHEAITRALRRAYHLSKLTPDQLWFLFGSQVSEEDFEACVETGDLDAVFAMIVSARLEFTIVQRNGSHDAVVRMIGSDIAGRYRAKQRDKAALCAWIACILAVRGSALN